MKMKLATVKNINQINLSGITISGDVVDGQIKSVTFTDSVGNFVTAALDSYNLRFYIPAPIEMETKYKVSGSAHGIFIDETMDEECLAHMRVTELEGKIEDSYGAWTVTKVEVPKE
jgi:hypothetical protein